MNEWMEVTKVHVYVGNQVPILYSNEWVNVLAFISQPERTY